MVWGVAPCSALAERPGVEEQSQAARLEEHEGHKGHEEHDKNAEADDHGMTRGARRRSQQRLRKRLGKLARTKAMPEESQDEPLRPVVLPVRIEIEEIPIFVIDEAEEEHKFELPMGPISVPMPTGVTAEKIVPVCSFQESVMLSESMDLEVADFFVSLPCITRVKKEQKPARQASTKVASQQEDPEVEVTIPESKIVRRATGIAPAQENIPTANTFVHFPVERALPRRRALSV